MRLLIKDILSINAVFNLSVCIMSKSLKILQLNAQKSPMVQLILLNDQDLASYGILILSEPHAWRIDVKVIVTPMSHSYWQPFLPSIINPEGWPFQAMIWVNKNQEAIQMKIASLIYAQ